MRGNKRKVNVYTLGGKYLLTFDSVSDACVVFDCHHGMIERSIERGTSFKKYQFRWHRNENDIAPAPEWYHKVVTTYMIYDRPGNLIDSDSDPLALANYYGITVDKLEQAYVDKTYLFKKYRVDKKIKIETNDSPELI